MPDGFRPEDDGVRPWRPPVLLLGSAALHAGGVVLAVLVPSSLVAVVALLVANHAVLAAVGLWPRSRSYGPNLDRLDRMISSAAAPARRDGLSEPERIGLTFDDGPDPEITPRVLDLLDRHGSRASFFCVGARAARHPEIVREIVERGHRVENHSQSHPWHFSLLGPRGMAQEIDRAQEVISAATGRPPRLFRPPAGFRNPLLEPILARRGLWLTSWSRRGFDTVERDPEEVLRRLSEDVEPNEILLMHDARAASGWRWTGRRRPLVLEVLPELLRRLDRVGLRAVPVVAPDLAESGSGPARPGRIGLGSAGP